MKQLIAVLIAVAAAGDAITDVNVLPPKAHLVVLTVTNVVSAFLGPLKRKKKEVTPE